MTPEQKKKEKKDLINTLIASSAAGLVSTVVTQPLDTIAVRKQTKPIPGQPAPEKLWKTFKKAPWATFRDLNRGLGVRLIKTIPATAATFGTVHYVSNKLEKRAFVGWVPAVARTLGASAKGFVGIGNPFKSVASAAGLGANMFTPRKTADSFKELYNINKTNSDMGVNMIKNASLGSHLLKKIKLHGAAFDKGWTNPVLATKPKTESLNTAMSLGQHMSKNKAMYGAVAGGAVAGSLIF